MTSVSEAEESSGRNEGPIGILTAAAWVWGWFSDDGSVTRNASFSRAAREADGANVQECSWESEPGTLCHFNTVPADTGGTGLHKGPAGGLGKGGLNFLGFFCMVFFFFPSVGVFAWKS